MRTISARKFRLAFPTLTEPVTVLLSKDGTFRELGTWTPAGTEDAKNFDTAAPWISGRSVPEFRPAPKVTHRSKGK